MPGALLGRSAADAAAIADPSTNRKTAVIAKHGFFIAPSQTFANQILGYREWRRAHSACVSALLKPQVCCNRITTIGTWNRMNGTRPAEACVRSGSSFYTASLVV